MSLLGRTPLLYEAEPARKFGARAGYSPARATTQTRDPDLHQIGRPSDVKEPPGPGFTTAPEGSATFMKLSKSTMKRMGYGSSGAKSLPSWSSSKTKRSGVERSHRSPHDIEGEHNIPTDLRHPTGLHARVHKADGWDAHELLSKVWKRRHEVNPHDTERETHLEKIPAKFGPVTMRVPKPEGKLHPTGNKYMLPHDMPGRNHRDPSVRARAWRMSAQAQANALGDSYTGPKPKSGERRSKEPAQVHVVRHKPSGRMELRTTFHGRKVQHPGKNYEVVHTAISEALARGTLLVESLPEPRRDPPLRSDAEIRARIAQLTQAGSHQAAAALSASLRAREQMRQSTASLPGLEGEKRATPASRRTPKPAKTLSKQQRAWRKTDQTKEKGAETQMLWTPQSKRPPGHKTQKLAAPPGASTEVIRTPEPKSLDVEVKKDRERTKTRVMPRVPVASDLLLRTPLLQELVTAGGVFATGLRPGSPLRSHPRDARHIPNPPRRSAVTTMDVGHTANTGAWVPDKKKREWLKNYGGHKKPKHQQHGRVRDSITKEFEAQPANVGGVLSVPMLKRSKLVG